MLLVMQLNYYWTSRSSASVSGAGWDGFSSSGSWYWSSPSASAYSGWYSSWITSGFS